MIDLADSMRIVVENLHTHASPTTHKHIWFEVIQQSNNHHDDPSDAHACTHTDFRTNVAAAAALGCGSGIWVTNNDRGRR